MFYLDDILLTCVGIRIDPNGSELISFLSQARLFVNHFRINHQGQQYQAGISWSNVLSKYNLGADLLHIIFIYYKLVKNAKKDETQIIKIKHYFQNKVIPFLTNYFDKNNSFKYIYQKHSMSLLLSEVEGKNSTKTIKISKLCFLKKIEVDHVIFF